MSRHVITPEEQARGCRNRSESWRQRRAAEAALLDRLLAEAAMPERYPER